MLPSFFKTPLGSTKNVARFSLFLFKWHVDSVVVECNKLVARTRTPFFTTRRTTLGLGKAQKHALHQDICRWFVSSHGCPPVKTINCLTPLYFCWADGSSKGTRQSVHGNDQCPGSPLLARATKPLLPYLRAGGDAATFAKSTKSFKTQNTNVFFWKKCFLHPRAVLKSF